MAMGMLAGSANHIMLILASQHVVAVDGEGGGCVQPPDMCIDGGALVSVDALTEGFLVGQCGAI